MPSTSKIVAAVGGIVAAIIAAALGVSEWKLSEVEYVQVVLMGSTSVALFGAVFAHFRPDTSAEPVAVTVSFTIWTESVFGTLVIFDIWSLTVEKAVLLQGVIVAVVGFVAMFVGRQSVVPVATVRKARSDADLPSV